MAYIYQEVNPTLITNTTMQLKIDESGNAAAYRITPNEGYVLHDKGLDNWYDNDGNELDTPVLGFRRTTATCGANYDFVANPREFYAVLENEVPADQIFGGTNPEIM